MNSSTFYKYCNLYKLPNGVKRLSIAHQPENKVIVTTPDIYPDPKSTLYWKYCKLTLNKLKVYETNKLNLINYTGDIPTNQDYINSYKQFNNEN